VASILPVYPRDVSRLGDLVHQKRLKSSPNVTVDTTIEDFIHETLLGIRAINTLKQVPLHVVGDLIRFGEHGLCRLHSCGVSTIQEIRLALCRSGLELPRCSMTCRQKLGRGFESAYAPCIRRLAGEKKKPGEIARLAKRRHRGLFVDDAGEAVLRSAPILTYIGGAAHDERLPTIARLVRVGLLTESRDGHLYSYRRTTEGDAVLKRLTDDSD
jgi:hypothetical protein